VTLKVISRRFLLGTGLAAIGSQFATAAPRSVYEIADDLAGECSDNSPMALRINARLRRIIQDFGFDPLYASYLMHFVFSSLVAYTGTKAKSFSSHELAVLSEAAIRLALRHFSDFPHSCIPPLAPETEVTAYSSSVLSSVEAIVPHPAFMSSSSYKKPTARYSPTWGSIENRPPLRPDWGERPVLLPSLQVDFEDPPSPFSPEFNAALAEVRECNESPTSLGRDLALFWNDSIGSTTPIGHWNAICCAILADQHVVTDQAITILGALNRVMYVSGIYCWKCKFQHCYPRPIQFFRLKRTVIKTPNFPSYPSGHSCFSAAAAHLIGSRFTGLANSLDEMALAASESRILGGVHFRFDCEAGLKMGRSIAKQMDSAPR
jgi:hypothetical protein